MLRVKGWLFLYPLLCVALLLADKYVTKERFTVGCYLLYAVLRVKGWLFLYPLLCVALLLADKYGTKERFTIG